MTRKIGVTLVAAFFSTVVLSAGLISVDGFFMDVTKLLDIAGEPAGTANGGRGYPLPAGATLIDTSDDGNYLLFSSLDPNVVEGEQSIPTVDNLYWMDVSKGMEHPVIRLVTHFAGSVATSAGYFGVGNGLLPPTYEPGTADLSGDGQSVLFDSRINANAYDATLPAKNDMPSVERDLAGVVTNEFATSDVFVWHATAQDPANNIATVSLLNSKGKKVAASLAGQLNFFYSKDAIPDPDVNQPMAVGIFIFTPRTRTIQDAIVENFFSNITNFIAVVGEGAISQGFSSDGNTALYQTGLPAQWLDTRNPNILDDFLPQLITFNIYIQLRMTLDGFLAQGTQAVSASAFEAGGGTQTATIMKDGNAQGYFNLSAFMQKFIRNFPFMPYMFYEARFLQLSSDGNRVAFSSRESADMLVAANAIDSDFSQDVYLFDARQNQNLLVSRYLDDPLKAAGYPQSSIIQFLLDLISGRPATYLSYDLFDSANLTMSETGTTVAFDSTAKNLIAGFIDNNLLEQKAVLSFQPSETSVFKMFGPRDLYALTLSGPNSSAGVTKLLNTPDGKTNTNLNSTLYALSSDGSTAFFETNANNFYAPPFSDPRYNPTFATGQLPPNFILGGFNCIWRRGIVRDAIELVTMSADRTSSGNKGSAPSPVLPGSRDMLPNVSESGRFLLFTNPSNNLVEGVNDPNFKGGVYLWDGQRSTKKSTLMSTKASGNFPSDGLFLQTSISTNEKAGIARVFMGGTGAEDMQTQYQTEVIDNVVTPHIYAEDFPRLVKASAGANPALFSISGENYNNSIIDFKRGSLVIKASPTPPFDGVVNGGSRVAMGDVNGDGYSDYVYGTPPTFAPEVIAIDGRTNAVIFKQALGQSSYLGGVFVAVGDINKDGFGDIAASYGDGVTRGKLEIYSGKRGFVLLQSERALEVGAGEARVAIGNLEGDEVPEVVLALGRNLSQKVSVYQVMDNPASRPPNDYAVAPKMLSPTPIRVITSVSGATDARPGVNIAAADMNGDGYDELVIGSEVSPWVKILDPAAGYTLWAEINLADVPEDRAYANGVRVAARPGEVIAASGRGGAEVRIYSAQRVKTPTAGVSPILQTFYPSNLNRWGTPNPVKGLFAG